MADVEKTLNSYVTDMLALEEHILKALNAQKDDLKHDNPDVAQHLAMGTTMITSHISALKAVDQSQDGSGIGEAVKRAGTVVAGLGAAAVDLVRTEKLPKNLRDDYTSGSLAYIGYVMLLTSAKAFGDPQVAELATQHMGDWAQFNMTLGELIPGEVVNYLRSEKLPVGDVNPMEINDTVRRVWEQVSRV
jgi:ferritin-like metal-binding protein YciE